MERRALLAAVFLMSMAGAGEAASTWYVKADAAAGGDGAPRRPVRHAGAGGNRVENGRHHPRGAVITRARRRDSTERWPAPDWAWRSRHKRGNPEHTHR